MSALVVQRSLMNVQFSLFKFLNENTYTAGVTLATLKQHFANLMIMSAYPDDLTRMTKPLLALGGLEMADQDPDFFGAPSFGAAYRIPLYGFVMGQGSDPKNRAYRDRLMSDLYEIFVHQCGDEGFDLYDADTKSLHDAGGLEITNARARTLPVNAPDIEADRFKFVFELDVPYA
jgi:hypothetical protein